MKTESLKKTQLVDRELEGGIEWIVARQLAPLENEIIRLRARVEALKDAMQPW